METRVKAAYGDLARPYGYEAPRRPWLESGKFSKKIFVMNPKLNLITFFPCVRGSQKYITSWGLMRNLGGVVTDIHTDRLCSISI